MAILTANSLDSNVQLHIKSGTLVLISQIHRYIGLLITGHVFILTRTRTRKLFIWQVQVQSYNKSGKKHNIIELYKYNQQTEAKVQEYRYRQSHLLGHAVSWVDHRKRRWVLLVLVCYVRIKVHM